MAEFQEPIRNDRTQNRYYTRNNYVYICNKCGKEVAGYYQKRVKGHVLCYDCRRKLAKIKYESKEYKRGFDDAMKNITKFASFIEDYIQLDEMEQRLIADVTHCILQQKGAENDKDMVSTGESR